MGEIRVRARNLRRKSAYGGRKVREVRVKLRLRKTIKWALCIVCKVCKE